MPENYVTNQTPKGNICISEEVIQVMVTAAVSEIEGVAGLTNPVSTDIAEFLGLKNAAKGIKISSEDGETSIDIVIMVRYGYNVTAAAKKVQEQVAANVESMTGMKARINVHVAGIAFDRADKKG